MTIHYRPPLCGALTCYVTGPGFLVTCKRCLASLAKRDREFQRKARAWFAARVVPGVSGDWRVKRAIRFTVAMRDEAARAIAREEAVTPPEPEALNRRSPLI